MDILIILFNLIWKKIDITVGCNVKVASCKNGSQRKPFFGLRNLATFLLFSEGCHSLTWLGRTILLYIEDIFQTHVSKALLTDLAGLRHQILQHSQNERHRQGSTSWATSPKCWPVVADLSPRKFCILVIHYLTNM